MSYQRGRHRRRWNYYLPGFLVAAAVAALLNLSDRDVISGDREYVQRLIDGDTLMLGTGERVRLLGREHARNQHPQKPVEAFGKEASAFTKRMVERKLVRLEFDPLSSRTGDGKDKYSFTLVYVFL
jgi:micrococcal nuclease